MKLELKIYKHLCTPEIFKINDIDASYLDFGDKLDFDPSIAQSHGCGNMQFQPYAETNKKVLRKYKITIDEYRQVQNELKKALSFGHCMWCA